MFRPGSVQRWTLVSPYGSRLHDLESIAEQLGMVCETKGMVRFPVHAPSFQVQFLGAKLLVPADDNDSKLLEGLARLPSSN